MSGRDGYDTHDAYDGYDGYATAAGAGDGSWKVTGELPGEDELRVLLERAVPHLPSPAQRLERVRERVRRRTRRRAAGLSVAAVLVVAAAGLLLPGVRTGGDTSAAPTVAATGARVTTLAPPASDSVPAGPSASGTAPGRLATDPPTPTTPISYPYRRTGFPGLTGLSLRLPAGWSSLQPAGADTDFVSSQPLGLPENGCAHALDDFCTPLAYRLHPGSGVLMMLQVRHNGLMADKFRQMARQLSAEPPVEACRTVGGTTQWGSLIVDGAGSDVVIEATVCLAGPTPSLTARVRDMLLTAEFS
ncbi:hypothetical protein ACFO3J_22685 [Streptomyces polygonati]|uniref:Uncharacterized protein n=1 Tax=Streptomyces polygonati TaxID=1617087 RepID=A0ABV8HQG9_9ACTN